MELPVKQFQTRAEQAFVDLFNAAEQGLPGSGNPWVADLRAKAIDAYAALGLPHRRVEAWKYTDLRSRLTEALPLARATGVAVTEAELGRALGVETAGLPAYRLVVVEGELRAELSDIAGLKAAGAEIISITEALQKPPRWLKAALGKTNAQDRDPVLDLNLALMSGGVGLRVRQGITLDKPVHLIHIDGGEPASVVTRNVVLVEEGASLDLVESYASLGGRELQRNAVTEIEVGDRAGVNHIKLQREGEAAFHLVTWLVKLDADANYKAFHFSTGAALSRSQIYAAFTGEGSSLDVSGALLMRDHQHCDTTLLVEHRVPRCTSRELFKAVLDNEARGVFQGKIIVSPGAQKTDGKQMAQALLLSETAEFDSKPELEIFADDVVCGHGSTSGQIDEDLLFYLEARGIPEEQARALLIQAFVGEAVERIEHEGLREALAKASAEWLGVTFD
ncbi:MAG TPA: Fe-S cluster assembly protein SufD [Methyloceanibacter sp.]|jgi:Fe-S cluster assembly protein SufD|nr:Fe-S cluster assembly protein SufD [Methyloceanibacter sp.]